MNRHALFPSVIAAFALLTGHARAYQILIDYNTFKVRDGIENASLLPCAGVWCILQNSDLTNEQWKTVFERTGAGVVIAEDNPAPHNVGQAPANNHDRTKLIVGRVDGTLCYNETGAKPGGTLLTDAQIDADAANHGGSVIALTRGYSLNPADAWRKATDHNLANPKVSGIAVETVNPYKNLACDALLVTALRTYHKPVYFLLPGGKEAYITECIEYLKSRQPELMKDPRVYIVICPYQTPGSPWFGEGTNTAQSILALAGRLNR